jgi:LuxR family maltose regulon positive regulatory protein
MTEENKQSKKRLYYFPDRLRRHLSRIPNHPVTVVEAPSGFGKTTAVREYLENALEGPSLKGSEREDADARIKRPVFNSVWSIIGEENSRNEWDILCDAMKNVDGELGAELEKLTLPYSDDGLAKMRNILQNTEEKEDAFIVLDNYQFVQNRIPPKLAEGFFQSLPPHIHLVFVTQMINPVSPILVSDSRVNHIPGNCLHFEADDIRAFYKLHNIYISKDQSEEIHQFTDGWVAAIYLTLLRYAEEGKFENSGELGKLIDGAVWSKLSINERKFLLRLSRFDSFDMEQARFMNEAEDIDKKILTMLEGNGFVYYRPREKRYFVHSILQEYVRKEFDAEPANFRTNVLRRTGKWHESQSQNFLALKYYSAVDDFSSLLKINLASSDFTATASAENKALLLSVLARCPKEALMEHPKALVVFAFTLFVYNEKASLLALCDDVRKMLSASPAPEEDKNRLLGELAFLEGFMAHNDFAKMAEGYRRAYELLGGPTSIINKRGPWTFGAPSVLYMFYRRNAEADTVCLEENLPAYLQVANGHGTGADTLMRGELQFNQGLMADAEITAHHSLYAAEGSEQLNIALCARFLLAQISIVNGEASEYKMHMKALKEKAEDSRLPVHLTMADLCLGFLFAVTDGAVPCPDWLKTEETLSRVRFMTRPYVDIVLSKSLLLSKEYAKLAGIGEELRKKAAHYPNALAEIYIAVHLALGCEALGKTNAAEKNLKEALSLALPDKIYMPLAQNYEALKPILVRVPETTEKERGKIAELHGLWHRGVEELEKASESLLTEREREAAVLVAQGLTNQEIANRLFVSPMTVKTLLARAFKKTETQSRAELSVWLLKDKN